MDINTKMMYSEVYTILNLMGESYIKKIPRNLYELIEMEKLDTYIPEYDLTIDLKDQKIQKESLALLVSLDLNYWCGLDERRELNDLLKANAEKEHQKMREMYSSKNIFKNEKEEEYVSDNVKEFRMLATSKKDGIFKRIFKKIVSIFKF